MCVMNLGIFGLAVPTRKRRRGAEMAAVPKRGLPPPVAIAVALSLIVGTASLEQTSFYGRLIVTRGREEERSPLLEPSISTCPSISGRGGSGI